MKHAASRGMHFYSLVLKAHNKYRLELMSVFLFFRLKRTALCRGTRKLSYGNCKVGWQCLRKARFNKLMLMFVGYFLSCECTQHLCLCACHIHRSVTQSLCSPTTGITVSCSCRMLSNVWTKSN